MFIITKTNRLIITRGDTATMQIALETQDGKIVPLEIGDQLTLSVKKTAKDVSPLIQLTADETGQFCISPDDTDNLACGVYLYDIQLTREGNIYTVIPTNYIEIKEEITR